MSIIIYIQGFINNDREFLPKEIGVTALTNGDTAHWILAPEFSFNLLTEERQLENNALTRKHGIEWYDGESMIKYVHTQLRFFCQSAMKVFTKGESQKSYLEILLCRPVINIDTLQDSPSVPSMQHPRLTCTLHSVLESRRNKSLAYNQCALSCADLLKQWLNNKIKNTENISASGENPVDSAIICPWGCQACNEYGASIKSYSVYTIPHDWSISSRQDSENLD